MSFSTLDLLSGPPSAAIIRDPLMVSPETAVLDAIAQMSHLAPRRTPIQVAELPTEPQLHASCALIVDQQQVVGIFTEQDVVSLTAQQQPLKGMTMGQAMTQPVITLTEADFTDLSVATQLLQQHQIRHLPMVDGQGALVGVVTYESLHQATTQQRLQQEQTARQQAEALLHESEQRYASLVAAAPVGIFRADAAGNCVYMNERLSQIMGLPLAAALGEGWQQGLHPEDREPVFRAWQQAAVNQQPFQLEYRFQHGDGTVRWVKGQAIAEQDAQGQITGYVGTITDITESKRLETERQQSERALAQSAAHQRAIIQAIPDLIVRVNRAGIFQEFLTSPSFRIFGNLADWVGTHISQQLPPQIAQQRLMAIDQVLTSQTIQIYEQDLSIEGTTQIEEVRVVPYGEDEVLMLVRDISDRKQLEAERQQAEIALKISVSHQKALISALPDLILRINRAGIYLEFVTTPDFPLIGCISDLVGTHVSDSLPWQAAQQRMDAIEQALQTRTTQIYEHDLSIQGKTQIEEVRVVPYSQDEVLLLVRDISERVRLEAERTQAESALKSLIAGTATTTGRDFFPALVSRLAETLGVSCALVAEQADGELRTLGFWANGALQSAYCYCLANTPCERALQEGEFYCESSVQQQFPLDVDLVNLEAEGYLGIALEDSAGKEIGHLSILDQKPITDYQRATQILRVFAARAAAELERQRATTALEQLNQALEAKVTERTLALQASAAQVRAMIGAIPDLLLRVKPDGNCLESVYPANSSHQFLPIREHLSEILPPDLLHHQLEQIGHAIAMNNLQIYEHQFRRDSRKVYEEVRINPLSSEEALIIVRDISDRKRLDAERQQAEMALQSRTEELDRFFSLALDLLCIADERGNFIRLNNQWENTLGYSLPELEGTNFMDYVHPEDLKRTVKAGRYLSREKYLFNFVHRYRCQDGTYRWLEWHSVATDQLIYAAARDITERQATDLELKSKTAALQQSYQDLKEAQLQLVQSEKMSSLGQLVAGIAHEINNPVSFIYGNLAAALDYTQDLKSLIELYQSHYAETPKAITDFIKTADINYILEDFPKLLKSMENGAVRIRDIVASLRTFSRLDQSALKATDIHENIDSTLVILQNRLNGRAGKPEIQVVKAYGDLPLIECYGGLLNQVFMNLLVNAIDAIESHQAMASPEYTGCITIETQRIANKVRISIEDNGTGMDAETQAHIFDPFFTTKPVGLGTGMGLSISYQIVTGNHQGQLRCHSVLGEGTEFSLELWQVASASSQAEVDRSS